ncbi:hypothetical protein GCM10025794_00450 [Massilia kyonggiensis]
MKILLLLSTWAIRAVVAGLYLNRRAKTSATSPDAPTRTDAGPMHEGRERAVANMYEKLTSILTRLERIEAKIDLLPDRLG